jgi:diguanylate cyclase (GGDEF)-like protein
MGRHFSNEPDVHVLAVMRPVEAVVLLTVICIAVFILGLWVMPGFDALGPPVWAKMTANTAVGMLLSVSSLMLARRQSSVAERWLGFATASIVLVLSLVTLAEYVTHISLSIDTWLPHDQHALHQGRPSPQAASEFTLLALCLLTMHMSKSRLAILADILALIFSCLTFVMFGGHLYGAIDLVGESATDLMAPQTLFCFFCLSAVVTIRRAEKGRLLAVLINVGIGSRIIRLILPAAIFLPFIFLGVDIYIIKARMLTEPYAHAITSASASTLILCIVTSMGWRINSMERDLRDLSLSDELTGIYNRRGFYFLAQQAIREADRSDSRLVLFFFDLDGLKHVNDALGHEAGSDMIRAFAKILSSGFRKADIVGRVGGDEFAVITTRDHDVRLNDILQRLASLTAAFNDVDGKIFRLSFSVGHVELNPDCQETLDDLIMRADIMMYRDKANKKLLAEIHS